MGRVPDDPRASRTQLHPEYDPAFQLEQAFSERARAMANEDVKRGLERVPSVDSELTVYSRLTNRQAPGFWERLPASRTYARCDITIDEGGRQHIFGEGVAGHNRLEAFIRQKVNEAARARVRVDPKLLAFARQSKGVQPRADDAADDALRLRRRSHVPRRPRRTSSGSSCSGRTLFPEIACARQGVRRQGVHRQAVREDRSAGRRCRRGRRTCIDATRRSGGRQSFCHAGGGRDVQDDAVQTSRALQDEARMIRRALGKAETSPSNKAILDIARQMRDESGEDRIFNSIGRIIPPLVLEAKPAPAARSRAQVDGLGGRVPPKFALVRPEVDVADEAARNEHHRGQRRRQLLSRSARRCHRRGYVRIQPRE